MAEDLRPLRPDRGSRRRAGRLGDRGQPAARIDPGNGPLPSTARRSDSDRGSIPIVPRGLRSFDEHDADFFLELLPGPRDRDGLPESIRFWKTQDRAGRPRPDVQGRPDLRPVGLRQVVDGQGGAAAPAGKARPAGLRRGDPGETEARLLRGLRKVCPELPRDLGLVDSLASLRRGRVLPAGRKVLLVLDQFEQWLHAEKEEEKTELVQALRQCDGEPGPVHRHGAR